MPKNDPFEKMSVKQARQGFAFFTILILLGIGWMTFCFYAQFLNLLLAAFLAGTMMITFAALGTLQLMCAQKIFIGMV